MKPLTPIRFVLTLFILSCALYGFLYILFTQIKPSPMPLYYMIPMLFVFTSGAFLLIVRTKNERPQNFVYSYIFTSLGKLFMYGAFVFIYAFLHREGARNFVLTFFVLYLLYTVIEIRAVLSYFKS